MHKIRLVIWAIVAVATAGCNLESVYQLTAMESAATPLPDSGSYKGYVLKSGQWVLDDEFGEKMLQFVRVPDKDYYAFESTFGPQTVGAPTVRPFILSEYAENEYIAEIWYNYTTFLSGTLKGKECCFIYRFIRIENDDVYVYPSTYINEAVQARPSLADELGLLRCFTDYMHTCIPESYDSLRKIFAELKENTSPTYKLNREPAKSEATSSLSELDQLAATFPAILKANSAMTQGDQSELTTHSSLFSDQEISWASDISREHRIDIVADKLLVALLRDYNDVVGFPDSFKRALSGEPVCLTPCKEFGVGSFTIDGTPSFSDMMAIYLNSKYGFLKDKRHRLDALRRIDRVIVKVGYENIALAEKDRSYLTDELAEIVSEAEGLSEQRYEHIGKLIDMASQPPASSERAQ